MDEQVSALVVRVVGDQQARRDGGFEGSVVGVERLEELGGLERMVVINLGSDSSGVSHF
jgi:hypothetical protein